MSLDETTDEGAGTQPPRALAFVARAAAHVAAILLQLAALAAVVNAVYRYSVGGGFPLIFETTRFVFFLVVFLGIAGTHLSGGHVQVELLMGVLRGRILNILTGWVVPMVSILFLSLLAYACGDATVTMFDRGTTTPSRPAVLLWPVMATATFGCALLIAILSAGLLRRIGRGAR